MTGQSEPKLFTPDEANALLPRVRDMLAVLRVRLHEILTQQAHIESEELVARREDGTVSVEVRRRLDEAVDRLNDRVQAFDDTLGQLQALGCHLKDLDAGLVDFCTIKDGDIVYLCWRENEPRIAWWHAVETGYAGRQPLDA